MRMTPFETYAMYIALKSHFTRERYDYVKYKGSTKASPATFEKRRDRYQFTRISKIVSKEDMQDYLVANILKDRKWIGEFIGEEAKKAHIEFAKRKQNFQYQFAQEIQTLFQKADTPRQVFQMQDGRYPLVVQALLDGSLSLPYFAILDHYVQFSKKYDQEYGHDYLWPSIIMKARKLYPLFEFDDKTARKVLFQAISEASEAKH